MEEGKDMNEKTENIIYFGLCIVTIIVGTWLGLMVFL